jgi:hypothetical protein
MNASNPTESTLYHIPHGHYDFINETENEVCECKSHNDEWPTEPEYPDDNVVRYDAYDGCYMVGNEDAVSLIMKFEGKAIKIVEI